MKLGEPVIEDFKKYVNNNKKHFAILYLPRESEFSKDLNEQDSWRKWLVKFCAKKEIDVIDPTDKLILVAKDGGIVYYDHLTELRHQAVAESFSNWFRTFIARRTK